MEKKKKDYSEIKGSFDNIRTKAGEKAEKLAAKTKESAKSAASKTKDTAGIVASKTRDTAVAVASKTKDTAGKAKDNVMGIMDANGDGRVDIEDIIILGLKTPGIRVDRDKFLRKEFSKNYKTDVIDKAIESNPMTAGISKDDIDKMVNEVIKYERYCVSGISAALGAPGGAAMAATIPADIIQYYGYMLRAAQKMMYLYGFPAINVDEENQTFDTETINILIVCLGVMYGVAGANNAIKVMAKALATGVEKQLMRKALTKGTIYPIVKSVSKWFSIRMTKEVFAGFFKNAIPVVGGVIGGGLTFLSFKPCCEKLKKSLQNTRLSNPDYDGEEGDLGDVIDVEADELTSVDDYIDEEEQESCDEPIEILEKFREYALKFPDEYEALNKDVSEEPDVPGEAVGCGIRTENTLGIVIAYPVSEEMSMKFDDEQGLIDELHKTMDENMGIIEVHSGKTRKRNKFIYSIRKTAVKQNFGDGNVYLLNMNIKLKNGIQFINASFEEIGTTGMRDSVIYSALQNKGILKTSEDGEISDAWSSDPYDAKYKKGFLMNMSEDSQFDKMFSDHPLSVARKFVDDIIKLN